MTNEEAIKIIEVARAEVEWEYPMEYAAAFDKAIEALKLFRTCSNCKRIERVNTETNIGWCGCYDISVKLDDICGEWCKND